MKKCKLCEIEKPLEEYYFRKESDKHRNECKECIIERGRVRNMGVSNYDYEKMFIKQEGQCKICECKLNSSRYTKFAVDHDHKTGIIRGLLCVNCNTALGLFKESIHRMKKAIDYLTQFEDIV